MIWTFGWGVFVCIVVGGDERPYDFMIKGKYTFIPHTDISYDTPSLSIIIVTCPSVLHTSAPKATNLQSVSAAGCPYEFAPTEMIATSGSTDDKNSVLEL